MPCHVSGGQKTTRKNQFSLSLTTWDPTYINPLVWGCFYSLGPLALLTWGSFYFKICFNLRNLISIQSIRYHGTIKQNLLLDSSHSKLLNSPCFNSTKIY